MPSHQRIKVNIGERYNRLVVIGEEQCTIVSGKKSYQIPVRCDCGCEFLVYKFALTHGKTRSCGCLRIEQLKERNKLHQTPGGRKAENFITLNGETHSIPEWAKILGIDERTIYSRIFRGETRPKYVLQKGKLSRKRDG